MNAMSFVSDRSAKVASTVAPSFSSAKNFSEVALSDIAYAVSFLLCALRTLSISIIISFIILFVIINLGKEKAAE